MLTDKRILIIINPTAGFRRPAKVHATIHNHFEKAGSDFTIRETVRAGDALKWARSAHAEGFQLVVVAGGDGTVRETVEGIMRAGSLVPLAQIPTGTANVVARGLSIPVDVRKALNVISTGTIARFDVGYLPDHDRYFTFVAGAGYDAKLIHDTPRELKKTLGFFAYVATGSKHFFKIRPVKIKLEMDEDVRFLKAHTVMGINIGSIANLQWSFAPNIDPHDGKLNITVASTRSWWGSLFVLIRILTKRYHGYADLKHFEAKRLRVTADPPLPVQIDGDPLGTTPFLAQVIPDGIQLVVPVDYPD